MAEINSAIGAANAAAAGPTTCLSTCAQRNRFSVIEFHRAPDHVDHVGHRTATHCAGVATQNSECRTRSPT
ncbi:MAG: hypothetical protein ACLQLO_04065 [Mycobacterium sp.]